MKTTKTINLELEIAYSQAKRNYAIKQGEKILSARKEERARARAKGRLEGRLEEAKK